MKVALVTTPPTIRSGIGDYTRHLLPYLREHCDVQLFVEKDADAPEWGDERARLVSELVPRDFDQILYQLGNELSHGFMPRMIRAIGGTVMQHDWVLFDMMLQAFPGLARGGVKGMALALREGGMEQLRLYSRNWADRRRQRNTPYVIPGGDAPPGELLAGWHVAEDGGRWVADQATFRIPARGVEAVTLQVHVDAPRRLRVRAGDEVLAETTGAEVQLVPPGDDRPVLLLETEGVQVTPEQRRHGDSRRLASFVQGISWTDAEGEHALDLSAPSAVPLAPVHLTRDRFRLPFNRSVVRHADAFLVHSRYVRDLIVAERNANTPIGLVHHGSEFRWSDDDRCDTRRELGLPPEWCEGFLITSFGGVQPHKRIDRALEALARARREREDIRFVLAGRISSSEFDPRAMARALGVADAVHFTGFVSEEEGWRWLHAGDLALNLRGPSSGGTSGGIFQAFSMGRSVIASDAAEQRELPDGCVVKVPLGEDEVPRLARLLVELRDDPERRRRLEESVRGFVREECHWEICARRYAEHMERFPRARAAKKSLVRVASERGA